MIFKWMYTKLFKKFKYLVLVIIISLLVYHRWLSFSIFSYSDWLFFFKETMTELLRPSIWVTPSYSFGNIDLTIWKLPLYFFYGLFGIAGLGFNVAEKFLIMWPVIFLPGLSSFLLIKKIVKHDLAAVIGSFVFSYNTYFLSINTQGHELLTIASSFAVITIWLFIEALERKKLYLFILTSLSLFITGSYDFRLTYITAIILSLYFIYHIFLFEFVKNKNELSKLFISSFSVILIIMLLNFYWLLALWNSASLLENDVLTRDLFGNQFFNILRSITLFHPFWNGVEPDWFIVQPIPIYFWLIPFFAFGGLLLNRENKYVLFFGIISLIGVLLAKQIAEPFPGLYMSLYNHLPGFSAFREASKFYFLIVLGYSVLIGAFMNWLLRYSTENKWRIYGKRFLILLIVFLLLWNTKPLINGEIGSLFVPREIPEDYLVIKDYVLPQEEYYRTLWTPADSRWSIYTYNHPKVSNINIIQSNWKNLNDYKQYDNLPIQQQIIGILKQPFSNNLLDSASIRYVIIPIQDTENDDDFFVYYGNRNFFIEELDKLDYLKKMDIGTKDIVVYENENYKPHIYSTDFQETIYKNVSYKNIDFKMVAPTKYTISLKNITQPEYLIFSESYHSGWKIRLGNFNWFSVVMDSNYFLLDNYHSKTDAMFNSFLIDPEYIIANYPKEFYKENPDGSIDVKMILYFKPQSYFYIGLIISILTFIGCIGYLFWCWKKDRQSDYK